MAVATLVRHQDAARELLLEPLSVEEFRIPVTEMDLNAQVRAIDAMFVPIRLETQGLARPLAMWDLPPVMRIQRQLTSVLHPVLVVDSQTIRIRLQGRPAVRFLDRLALIIAVLHVDPLVNLFEPYSQSGTSCFEKFKVDHILSRPILIATRFDFYKLNRPL